MECEFRVYQKGKDKGEYYFYAAAIVISPEDWMGLRTVITRPLFDTPAGDLDEHVEWVLLRRLGVDVENIDVEDLEDAAAKLEEE